MMIRRWIAGAVAGAAVFVLMAASGSAWPGSEPNNLTFSGPVALPGVVLPAGTYVFERPSWNSPDLVRVVSEDRKHVYFMAFTLEVPRPRGLDDRVVTFGEAKRGAPRPIAAWYPIDSATGHQFIY